MEAFRECWKQHGNDQRTGVKDIWWKGQSSIPSCWQRFFKFLFNWPSLHTTGLSIYLWYRTKSPSFSRDLSIALYIQSGCVFWLIESGPLSLLSSWWPLLLLAALTFTTTEEALWLWEIQLVCCDSSEYLHLAKFKCSLCIKPLTRLESCSSDLLGLINGQSGNARSCTPLCLLLPVLVFSLEGCSQYGGYTG